MGYFGHLAFENDVALDWLSALTERNALRAIKKACRDSISFNPGDVEPYSPEEIDELVGKLLAYYKQNPLQAWKVSGRTLEDHLLEIETENRERYNSGRYLDEEYGPIEPAIAAGELVALWNGALTAQKSVYAKDAQRLVSKLARKPCPAEVISLAREALERIVVSERYIAMRNFYLGAFADLSGGDDSMQGVTDILNRLRSLDASATK
jgi:hypothetical protein